MSHPHARQAAPVATPSRPVGGCAQRAVPAAWALRVAASALLCAAAAAHAAPPTLWRCGPDGRVFTDRPCADGAPMARAAAPSAGAVAEARGVAAREQDALRRLAAERREREALPARAGTLRPAGILPTPSARAAPEDAPTPEKRRRAVGYPARAPG